MELPACLLAVWKIGAAYVPLDPSHPADRIEYILGDACVQVLLTHSSCRLRPRGIRTIEIDREQVVSEDNQSPSHWCTDRQKTLLM